MRSVGFKSVIIFILISLFVSVAFADRNRYSSNPVVVTVNKHKITDSHVNALIQKEVRMAIDLGKPPSPAMRHNMMVRALDELVEKVLIEDRIRAKKVGISVDEVDREVANIAKSKGMSIKKLLSSTYSNYNVSAREFRDRVAMGLRFDKLIELEAGPGAFSVSDSEAKRFYQKNKRQEFVREGMVKASHIMIRYPSNSRSAKSDVKFAMTKIAKMAGSGKDFVALARKYSEDKTTSSKGGDLGFFTKENMPPKLAEIAFSLKAGQISDVIEMPYGCHVIKVYEVSPAGVVAFDKVKGQIVTWVENDKKDIFSRKYVQGLVNKAKIKWTSGKRPELIPIKEDEFGSPGGTY